ncbi:MAG: hypothetical protein ACJAZS_000142 [Alteromonas naphthalenivorans]|jgi:hypothetical protein
MKIKINLTLLALIIAATPLIQFSPLYAMGLSDVESGLTDSLSEDTDGVGDADLRDSATATDDSGLSTNTDTTMNESNTITSGDTESLNTIGKTGETEIHNADAAATQSDNTTASDLNQQDNPDVAKAGTTGGRNAADVTDATGPAETGSDDNFLAGGDEKPPEESGGKEKTPAEERVEKYKKLKDQKSELKERLKDEQAKGDTFGEKQTQEKLEGVNKEITETVDSMVREGDDLTAARRGRDTGNWADRTVKKIGRGLDYAEDGIGGGADWVSGKGTVERIRVRGVKLDEDLNTATSDLDQVRARHAKGDATDSELKAAEEKVEGVKKQIEDNKTVLRKIGRGIKDTVKTIGRVIKSVVSGFAMLIGQALAFTVPSALYQMTVAAEAKEALYQEVSAPQQFGNLWLQIPPQLVNKNDATSSAFLYCEVPDSNKQSASYFNPSYLKTANYYVSSATQPTYWGTTYIGSATFTGAMVNLNTGWNFTGNGTADSAGAPTFPLIDTISTFVNRFINMAGATTFSHTAGAADWVRMDSSSLMAKSDSHSFNDPTIRKLFMSPTPAGGPKVADALAGIGQKLPPAPLFYNAISKFRTPTSPKGFGGLKIQQMEGNGFLNVLLNNDINYEGKVNEPLRKALGKLKNENEAFNKTMSVNPKTGDIFFDTNQIIAIKKAQEKVSEELKDQQAPTTEYGFSIEENINARGIYIYEIVTDHANAGVMTPSLHALLRNTLDAYVPLKEYVICLDAQVQMVPLYVPQVVGGQSRQVVDKSGKTKTVKTGAATVQLVVNPAITYISSLTTGLTYEQGSGQGKQTVENTSGTTMSDVKLLTPYMTADDKVDFSYAAAARSQALNAAGGDMNIVNQIVAMTNFTTSNSVNGPFTTYSGYKFTRVPLTDLLGGSAINKEDKVVSDMAAILSNASSKGSQEASQTQWSQKAKLAYLSKFYIYQVTHKNGDGTLSPTNKKLTDYVIALGGAEEGSFQIMPLGTDQVTGGLNAHGVEGVFSLITGRGYDVDLNDLPLWYTVNMKPLSQGSYFPIHGETSEGYEQASSPEEQEVTIFTKQGGKRVSQKIRVIPNVYMGAAFMPTHYNPYNRYITNEPLRIAYEKARKEVIQYGLAFQSQTASLKGLSAATKDYGLTHTPAFLRTKGFSEELINRIQSVKSTKGTASNLAAAQDRYEKLQAIVNTHPGVTAWKPSSVVLDVPPLYYLFFPGLSYCQQDVNSIGVGPGGGSAAPAPPSGKSQQAIHSTTMNWPVTQPCQAPTRITIGKSTPGTLMSVLPEAFSGFNLSQDLVAKGSNSGPRKQKTFYAFAESVGRNKKGKKYLSILATYTEWNLSQDATNYWVESGFMGPFNFTKRVFNNVYITATSREDVAKGHFFYRASGFSPNDIFVCAEGPANGMVTALNQLKNIGRPYASIVAGNYLINVGTGQVYTPYVPPGAKEGQYLKSASPYACSGGDMRDINCSLQPVGQNVYKGGTQAPQGKFPPPVRTGVQVRFNTDDILMAALNNQGKVGSRVARGTSIKAIFATLPLALQNALNTAMQSAQEQIQKSLYPIYFGKLTLSLNREGLTNGNYIYAVTPTSAVKYGQAHDYVAVADLPDGNFKGLGGKAITPYTKTLMSLVTGSVYTVSGQSIPNYLQSVVLAQNGGREGSVPSLLMQMIERSTKSKINPALAQRIMELNTLYIRQGKELQKEGSLLNSAPQLPIEALKHARAVTQPTIDDASVPSSHLITVGGEYFLQAKSVLAGTDKNKTQSLTTIFDFNATDQKRDSSLGVYYTLPKDKNSQFMVPTSALTGFELEAMRAAHGIAVAPNGEQEVTIPVTRIPLPLGPGEKTLIPDYGKDGRYMVNAKHINPVTNNAKGERYYYYYHIKTRAYYALVQDVTGNAYTKGESKAADNGYFVDLMSGDEYYVNGQPRMEQSSVAYALQKDERGEVVDVQQPLFMWGQANNSYGGQSLNVMANVGQGYSQYMYVQFSSVHKFQSSDKSKIMYLGYHVSGEGAGKQITPMRMMGSAQDPENLQRENLSVPKNIDTSGMTQSQVAELAYTSEVEQVMKAGWKLYRIDYDISPSGMQNGSVTFSEMTESMPKRYQMGNMQYVEGGIQGFKYPLAQTNKLTQALVYGRSFVAEGMGNRKGHTGIPTGIAALGTALCGVTSADSDAMIGFIPSMQSDFYVATQGTPRLGQFADYQSRSGGIQAIVTNYSLTGQKSASGVAIQSSYLGFRLDQQDEAIYGFAYSYASDKKLSDLKQSVNVFTNAEGHMQLVQEISATPRVNVSVPQGSIGSDYLIGFSNPVKRILYRIPPLRVAESYFEKDKTQYDTGDGSTARAFDLFKNMVSTYGVGTLVDYSSGAIFEPKKSDKKYLYPTGNTVSMQGLKLIRKQFKNATADPGSLRLTLPGSISRAIHYAQENKKPPMAPGARRELVAGHGTPQLMEQQSSRPPAAPRESEHGSGRPQSPPPNYRAPEQGHQKEQQQDSRGPQQQQQPQQEQQESNQPRAYQAPQQEQQQDSRGPQQQQQPQQQRQQDSDQPPAYQSPQRPEQRQAGLRMPTQSPRTALLDLGARIAAILRQPVII